MFGQGPITELGKNHRDPSADRAIGPKMRLGAEKQLFDTRCRAPGSNMSAMAIDLDLGTGRMRQNQFGQAVIAGFFRNPARNRELLRNFIIHFHISQGEPLTTQLNRRISKSITASSIDVIRF
jgi:hypothetical protein